MTQRQWLSADALTGRILAYLPGVEAAQPLRRTIGQYDTAQVNLHIDAGTTPEWERAILEGGSALICYSGASGSEVIEWGGLVIQSPRDLTSTVQLSLVTPDGYLDRQYVGDYTATGRDQNLIVTDLVEQFAAGADQIPIVIEVAGGAGTSRDRSYLDADNKSVFSALTELAAVSGGPEWMMGWDWDHSTDLILPKLTVGTRVGNPAPMGLNPNVTFDEQSVQTATIGHDYTAGVGANRVTCYSSTADSGPATETASDLRGRPVWQYRFSPSTSILHTTVLDAHALRALATMEDGGHPISIVIPRDQPGFVLGVDWGLGDDIGYSLASPSIPTRVEGVARVVAYETTPTTVTPVLKVIS